MVRQKRQYVVAVNSVREIAYRTLRNEIVSMELKPGMVISTQDIANRLNISRTPVREAFIKLQGEELLEISPQKATVVSRIDVDRLYQEWFIREALEVANMRKFPTVATKETIESMRRNIEAQYQALKEKDYVKYLELDNSFHQMEFLDTGEALAASLLVQMNGHYDRIRLITANVNDRAEHIVKEHEKLVDCIAKKNADGAVTLLQQHIRELQYYQNMAMEMWPEYFVHH